MYSTFFQDEIYTEFAVPEDRDSERVIILCSGMPGAPGKSRVAEYFVEQGFWVFDFRYRGLWESRGEFLKFSPEQDVIDIIESLERPFVDLWSGEKFSLSAKEIYVIGGSFGGPAALLSSLDERVTRAIALAPVVDWTNLENTPEPLDKLGDFLQTYLAHIYTFDRDNWSRLEKGEIYNPMHYKDYFEGSKILMLWNQDDEYINPDAVLQFAEDIQATHKAYKSGGHFGLSMVYKDHFIEKRVRDFLTLPKK